MHEQMWAPEYMHCKSVRVFMSVETIETTPTPLAEQGILTQKKAFSNVKHSFLSRSTLLRRRTWPPGKGTHHPGKHGRGREQSQQRRTHAAGRGRAQQQSFDDENVAAAGCHRKCTHG